MNKRVDDDPYYVAPLPWPRRLLMAPVSLLTYVGARLPLPSAHVCADALAFLAYRVARYRRRIVAANIAACFPDMTPRGRLATERRFYRNLADYFFQTLALTALSDRAIMRRITFEGTEALSAAMRGGRDVVFYTSHFGNWEYITSMPLWMPRDVEDGIIFSHVNRPLKNVWFNRFFHRLRSRYNVSVPMRDVLRAIVGWRREGRRFIMGFLSDQKPGRRTRAVEVPFLGRPTPFIAGTEDIARRLRCAAYYTDVRRTGRDTFAVTIRHMTDDASLLPDGELTRMYAAMLTETIRRDPASYLWSHNRWRLPKHTDKK